MEASKGQGKTLRELAEEALRTALVQGHSKGNGYLSGAMREWAQEGYDAAREDLFAAIERVEERLGRVEALPDAWDLKREADCLESDLRDVCAAELREALRAGKDGPQ